MGVLPSAQCIARAWHCQRALACLTFPHPTRSRVISFLYDCQAPHIAIEEARMGFEIKDETVLRVSGVASALYGVHALASPRNFHDTWNEKVGADGGSPIPCTRSGTPAHALAPAPSRRPVPASLTATLTAAASAVAPLAPLHPPIAGPAIQREHPALVWHGRELHRRPVHRAVCQRRQPGEPTALSITIDQSINQ